MRAIDYIVNALATTPEEMRRRKSNLPLSEPIVTQAKEETCLPAETAPDSVIKLKYWGRLTST